MIWLVLLNILKWAGIILAWLAALLLLLCMFVLLSRLRYDAHVDKNEKWRVHVTVKWLFSLVRIEFRMVDETQSMKVRLFWRMRRSSNRAKVEGNPIKPSDESPKAATIENKEPTQKQKRIKQKKKNKPKKESRIARFRQQIQMIVDYPDKRLILEYTKELIVRLLRALRPKRFALRGVIGFEDPSLTGKALGALGVIAALTGLNMVLHGNFEEPEIKGHGAMAGKVTLWALLWPLVRYVCKKPIWRIVKPMIFKRKHKKESIK